MLGSAEYCHGTNGLDFYAEGHQAACAVGHGDQPTEAAAACQDPSTAARG